MFAAEIVDIKLIQETIVQTHFNRYKQTQVNIASRDYNVIQ